MANVIVILVLLAIFAFGMKEMVLHIKGEGACCGGPADKPEKKKLEGKILHTYTFRIEGMHCQNCANAVTKAINEIEGASAKVSLGKKTAKVSCDRDVDPETIRDAVQRRGYEASEVTGC